jgi:hypothetical protein
MSDMLTAAQLHWCETFLGFSIDANGVAANGMAAPGGGYATAPNEDAPGGPGTAGTRAPPRPAPPATSSVKTASGTFNYLKRVEIKVEPVISEADRLLGEAAKYYRDLIGESVSLERLEDKYGKLDDATLASEINIYTDRILRDEAGQSQTAKIQADNLTATLKHIATELGDAETELATMNKEIEARDLHERGAALIKLGREQEERFAAPLKLVSGLIGVLDAKESIAEAPDKALPWAKPAVELLDKIFSIESEFTRQGMALEAEATKLDGQVFAERSKRVRVKVQNLAREVPTWKKLVERADRDVAQKRANSDGGYDAKSKRGGGSFRFQDLKTGVELCGKVHHLATEASANAHNARILLVGLNRLQGDYANWMANPAKDGRVFEAMLADCRSVYTDADPKVGWSNRLAKTFQQLYEKAQNLMADAPG